MVQVMAQTIGEKIAALRRERHITQTELAEYLFLVPQTVSKWEKGNGTPDIALLPKIADFFGVSVDELFSRSALEKTKDLVLKYSVLRDENSFKEAFDCIRSQIQTLDSTMENGIGDRAELEYEKKTLQGYEIHLLLQQAWESGQRALNITEELSRKTGELPFRLQRLQLRIMLGKRQSILPECRKELEENPSLDNLCIYFEALLLLECFEELLEFQRSDVIVRQFMFPPSEKNVILWNQYTRAAAETGDADSVEACEDIIKEYGSELDYYYFLWTLEKAYQVKSDNGSVMEKQKYENVKQKLISMLPRLPELYDNQYVAHRNRQMIERL